MGKPQSVYVAVCNEHVGFDFVDVFSEVVVAVDSFHSAGRFDFEICLFRCCKLVAEIRC